MYFNKDWFSLLTVENSIFLHFCPNAMKRWENLKNFALLSLFGLCHFGPRTYICKQYFILFYQLDKCNVTMSTYKSLKDQIKEIEYWLRLATLLHGPIKQYLLSVRYYNE